MWLFIQSVTSQQFNVQVGSIRGQYGPASSFHLQQSTDNHIFLEDATYKPQNLDLRPNNRAYLTPVNQSNLKLCLSN
jgi:hypothetical protein